MGKNNPVTVARVEAEKLKQQGGYVVQQGDSWAKIAGEMGGDQRKFAYLANKNGGVGRVLQPGDVINIPGGFDRQWSTPPYVSPITAAYNGMSPTFDRNGQATWDYSGMPDNYAGPKLAPYDVGNLLNPQSYPTAPQTAGPNKITSVQSPTFSPLPQQTVIDMLTKGGALWSSVPLDQRKATILAPGFDITKLAPDMYAQVLPEVIQFKKQAGQIESVWDAQLPKIGNFAINDARGNKLPWWTETVYTAFSSPQTAPLVQGALPIATGLWRKDPTMIALGVANVAAGYAAQSSIPWVQQAGSTFANALMYAAQKAEQAIGTIDRKAGHFENKGDGWKWIPGDNVPITDKAAWEAQKLFYEKQGTDFANPLTDRKAGQAWVLGASQPVDVNVDLEGYRQRVLNGENPEQVFQEYQTKFGVTGLAADLGSNFIFDPLNKVGEAGKLAGEKFSGLKAAGAERAGNVRGAKMWGAVAESFTGTHEAGLSDLVKYGIATLTGTGAPGGDGAITTLRDMVRTGKVGTVNEFTGTDAWSRFFRTVGGLDESGNIRNLQDNGKKSWMGMMLTMNPDAKARDLHGIIMDNMTNVFSQAGSDAREIVKLFNTWANADLQTASDMSADYLGAPEAYTSIPAIRMYRETAAKLLADFELATPGRQVLEQMASHLGVTPDDLVKSFRDGYGQQEYNRLLDKLAKESTKEAKTFGEKLASMPPSVVEELFKPFVEGKTQATVGGFRVEFLNGLSESSQKWLADYFGVKPDSQFFQLAKTLKNVQTLMLLSFAPSYPLNNGMGNMMNMAATGTFGFTPGWVIDDWLNRMAVAPSRLKAGVSSLMGEVADVGATNILNDAATGKGLLVNLNRMLKTTADKVGIFGKMSSSIESASSKQSTYQAMKRFWSRTWKQGLGYDAMPKELIASLDRINPAYKKVVYGAIDAGMNWKEVEGAITRATKGAAERNAYTYISQAADANGLKAQDVTEILQAAGVLDELHARLKVAKSGAEIDAVLNLIDQKAMNWADAQAVIDLTNTIPDMLDKVQAAGFPGAIDILDELEQRRFGNKVMLDNEWDATYAKADELWGLDTFTRREMMRKMSERASAEWKRTQAYEAATYKALSTALGMRDDLSNMLLTALNDEQTSFQKFHEEAQAARQKFFKTAYPSKEARNMAWLELERQLNDEHAMVWKKVMLNRARMAQALELHFETTVGMGAGKGARTWMVGVMSVDEQMRAEMGAFRKSIEGRSYDERAKAWAEYKPNYQKLYQDRLMANAEGIRNLYRGMDNGNVPPMPPNMPPEAPSVGPEAAPVQPTPPTAPAAPAASATLQPELMTGTTRDVVDRILNENRAEVWKKAQELGYPGVDESGKPVPNAALDLIIFTKLWGAQGIKTFDDLTPGVLEKAHANKAAYDERQMRFETGKQTIDDIFASAKVIDAAAPEPVTTTPDSTTPIDAAPVETPPALPAPGLKELPAEIRANLDFTGLQDDVNAVTPKKKQPKTLLQAIKEAGGLDIALAKDVGRDTKGLMPGLFRKPSRYTGFALDHMVQSLIESGFMDEAMRNNPMDNGGMNTLADMVQRAMAGEKIYPIDNAPTIAPKWMSNKTETLAALANLEKGIWVDDPLYSSLLGEALTRLERSDQAQNDPAIGKYFGIEPVDPTQAYFSMLSKADNVLRNVDMEIPNPRDRADYLEYQLDELIQNFDGRYLDPKLDETFDATLERFDGEIKRARLHQADLEAQAKLAAQLSKSRLQMDKHTLIEMMNESFSFTPEQSDAVAALWEKLAKGSKRFGLSEEQWYNLFAGIRKAGDATDVNGLQQRGAMYRADLYRVDRVRELFRSTAKRTDWIDAAVQEFGLTKDFKEAGWILPDGRMLDFSGKNEGGTPGRRAYDHRDINRVVLSDGTSALVDFAAQTGAVRFSNHSDQLLIDFYNGIPSDEQIRAIKKAASINADITWAINDARGNDLLSGDGKSSPREIDKIVGYTRRIFEGSETGQAMMAKFEASDGMLFQKVFHGSPYKFDKFSLDHMGKGEGAQAFGWASKYAKKWGAEVRETQFGETRLAVIKGDKVGGGNRDRWYLSRDGKDLSSFKTEAEAIAAMNSEQTSVHFLPVTDAMKESVTQGQSLFQAQQPGTPKGMAALTADGRRMIYAFHKADISTIIHETAHVIRPYINGADLQVLERWANVKDGQWVTEVIRAGDKWQVEGQTFDTIEAAADYSKRREEQFARAFERYLIEGDAPLPTLRRVFEQFKHWMLEIYDSIKGSSIDVELTLAVRRVFDNLLGAEEYNKSFDALVHENGGDIQDTARRIMGQYDNREAALSDANAMLADNEQRYTPEGWLFDGYTVMDAIHAMDNPVTLTEDPLDKATHGHNYMNRVTEQIRMQKADSARLMNDYQDQNPGMPLVLRKDQPEIDKRPWVGAVIAPSTKTPGRWQVTFFDSAGFSSDFSETSQTAAVWEVYRDGFRAPDPTLLDEVASTPQFQAGNEWTMLPDEKRMTTRIVDIQAKIEAQNTGETSLYQMPEKQQPGLFDYARMEQQVNNDQSQDSGMAGGMLPGMGQATGMLFDVQDAGKRTKMEAGNARTIYEVIPGKSTIDARGAELKPGDMVQVGKTMYSVKGVNVEGKVITHEGKMFRSAQVEKVATQNTMFQTFDPNNPNILKQVAGPEQLSADGYRSPQEQNQPLPEPSKLFQDGGDIPLLPPGGHEQISQFSERGRLNRDMWNEQVKPLLDSIRKAAHKDTTPLTLEGIDPQTMTELSRYLRTVKGKMATNKLMTMRWGETVRDYALLPYHRQYGFDKGLSIISPYQFFMTRSMMNWMYRSLDRPAWLANYARWNKAQQTYANNLPDRMKGKIYIPAPFLPEGMGGGMYIDPTPQLFQFKNFTQPLDAYARDNNYTTNNATYIIQDWADNQKITDQEATMALQSHTGPAWERAYQQAKMDRESESPTGFDYASMLLSPALYATIPYYLATGKKMSSSSWPASELPMTRTGNALQQAFKGTSLEWLVSGIGGVLAAPENAARDALNLPKGGEFAQFYVERQLANLVAEGKYSVQDAKKAMIEQAGPAWKEAAARAQQETMLRVPGMAATQQAAQGNLGAASYSAIPSLFPAGILPEAEMQFRGQKSEYNRAWDALKNGDETAIKAFWDKYPEYDMRRTLRDTPDERLRSYLVSEIWNNYNQLDKYTKKVVKDALGNEFNDAFLNPETRSPESVTLDKLAIWARSMGGQVPSTEKLPATSQISPSAANTAAVQRPDPAYAAQVNAYYNARDSKFPDYYVEQSSYYDLPAGQARRAYLLKYPTLKAYWNWKADFLEKYPEVALAIETQDYQKVDLTQFNPLLIKQIKTMGLSGVGLTPGAEKYLIQLWVAAGKPGKSATAWLKTSVLPAVMMAQP